MTNMSKREAESKAKNLLAAARDLAEIAEDLVNEYELYNMNFNLSRSHGVTDLSWYNSSESC